jgi:flagellar motor switch protein FliN
MMDKGNLTQEEIETLLGKSQLPEEKEPFQFTDFSSETITQITEDQINMQLLLDIPLEIVVELGKTKKKISEVLELSSGSILELDKMAGEPVEVYVNNKLVAKGEVVVIDEHFGVRITEIAQSPF